MDLCGRGLSLPSYAAAYCSTNSTGEALPRDSKSQIASQRHALQAHLFFFVTEKDEHPSAPFLKIGAYEHKALCESELSLCSIRIHALGIQQRGYFYKQGLSRSSYVVTGYKY